MFKPSDTVTFKPYAPYGESHIETEDRLRSYGGQTATVIRKLGPEDADEEVGNMYEIMFENQYTGTAFEDELTAVPDSEFTVWHMRSDSDSVITLTSAGNYINAMGIYAQIAHALKPGEHVMCQSENAQHGFRIRLY